MKNNIFLFSGRLKRLAFFYRWVPIFIISAFLNSCLRVWQQSDGYLVLILVFVFILFISVYQISLGVRRLHDLGLSGLWILLSTVAVILLNIVGEGTTLKTICTLIVIIFAFVLFFAKGTTGPNKYGEDPSVFKIPDDNKGG